MSDNIRYATEENVAVITIDNPPVNALKRGVAGSISGAIERANDDPSIAGILLIGAGRTFVAGADISELSQVASGMLDLGDELPNLLATLEGSPKPIVVAIHGNCLGGGMELALACHYRVATPDSRLGQPEVKIGLIPGAHGTQRLPRLCGIAQAAEFCATGKNIPALQAFECGIIDALIDSDLLSGALKYTRDKAIPAGPRKTSEFNDRLVSTPELHESLATLRATIERKSRGQIAPAKAIEAVALAATLPFEEAITRERALFHQCITSPQCKGLIHAFFGHRAVNKIPGITRETPRQSIDQAAVIGGGTMGGGITMTYINAGIPVTLKEIDQSSLDESVARIRDNYMRSVTRGRITKQQMNERLSLITPTLDYADISDADIIIEAVFESLDLKKTVFAEIDRAAKATAILASNTSTLDLDQIAAATGRPDRVIGHHFFSPAYVMKLLEIVRGKATSDDVIATSMDLAKRLGKVGVLVGNCFGFLGNRMFMPYLAEAEFLVEEGAGIEQVDHALYDFGMAMGPLAVADLAGIDVGWRIEQEVKESLPEGMRRPLITTELYEAGRFGQKTGCGWYQYEDGRTPNPDPEVDSLVRKTAQNAGIEQRTITDQEIVERTVYALVNEGARLLEDGIALRAVDIDIVYLNGYGFPAVRGGPMKHADMIGLKVVCDRIEEYHRSQGFWWEPAPLLVELAEAGSTFSEYDRQQAE